VSSPELGSNWVLRSDNGDERRRAAIRIADQIGREHPHPLDDYMPGIAAADTARNPAVRNELTELLDAILGKQTPRRKP
jgi:hypothetical protein